MLSPLEHNQILTGVGDNPDLASRALIALSARNEVDDNVDLADRLRTIAGQSQPESVETRAESATESPVAEPESQARARRTPARSKA